MARILMNLVLMRYGYPPAIIKTQEKEAYFSALQQADGGQFDVFADYIAQQVCLSLQTMLDGAMGKDISETTDLDKEIALMNALIAQRNSRLSISKDAQSVEEVFESSFIPLVMAVTALAKKFQIFYGSIRIEINGGGVNEAQLLTALQEDKLIFGVNAQALSCSVEFKNFNYRSLDIHSHLWLIVVKLRDASFGIDIAGIPKLVKTYTERISPQEIKNILDQLSQSHMAHIKQITGIELPSL